MKRYVQLLHNYNMFKDYDEALLWLYEQKKKQRRENLFRIEHCIKLLDIKIPYKVIHIAGTNGKGSTASLLNQMLMLKGKRVGMFVSPYVISFQERIEVNKEYISKDNILKYLERLREFAGEYQRINEDTIPFFELTFLMALLYFEDCKIDVLVLECGLGGLLDATNAVKKDVSVITNIGYDHMAQLGNTLEEISLHKLGITRKNIPCFTTVDEALIPFFKAYAKENGVPMYFVGPEISNIQVKPHSTCFCWKNESYETRLCGLFQAYNAGLALAVMLHLYPDTSRKLLDQALKMVDWPGRFEFVKKNIILDGAHNLPGIEALCQSLKLLYPKKRIKVVFTALRDKAVERMLEKLDEVAELYYFTTILDARASNVEDFSQITKKPYKLYSEYKAAIKESIRDLKESELLVVTGSLHFISEARMLLLEEIKS
ncbi:MAG: hypothetical protein K2N64_07435 [Anaeroplasmataceae bacterium]|nr:hypothetical protein [Anaeroplasmataceae bacterium]